MRRCWGRTVGFVVVVVVVVVVVDDDVWSPLAGLQLVVVAAAVAHDIPSLSL
jgi:hypothetical protein